MTVFAIRSTARLGSAWIVAAALACAGLGATRAEEPKAANSDQVDSSRVIATAAEFIAPNANLRADQIPPIPRALAERVKAYTEFRSYGFVDWHPVRNEILARHRGQGSNTTQLFVLHEAGASAEQLTDFPEPITSGAFDPRAGKFIVYPRDAGGNEATQIFRMDLDTRRHTLLSDPNERSSFVFSNKGDRLLLSSVPLDRTTAAGKRDTIATTLSLVDPLAPQTRKTIAVLPGGGWFAFRFAPDDQSLVMIEYKSATESAVWRLYITSGRRTQLLPASADVKASYSGFEFSPDGKTLYLVTNENSEFNRLAAYDLAGGAMRVLSDKIAWDVENFRLSEDGKHLAAVVNADGVNELHLFDTASGAELPRPVLPAGAIGALEWHRRQVSDLALSLSSPSSPGDIYVLDASTLGVKRWTSAHATIDPSGFSAPQIVRWKSFDGRQISGILYLPPARFGGKRPVLVNIHGGPEGQATVNFMGRWNYFLNELGVAILEPNVRGSSGYGKTFLDLDNGFHREDSVRDIGALLDWLPQHERLDASRVMVTGGSYGGYMVLASLVHYSDRLRGGIDVVGISNFVSFLNNTETYRRDLRRAEYGDERDPAMKAHLERISPSSHADRITVPLFVVHGRNDPRVPYTEAERIVEQVRARQVPVWYLLADNEGHGFARKANADFYFYSMIRFVDAFLLGVAP